MSKPWEAYQTAEQPPQPPAQGPWSEYQTEAPVEEEAAPKTAYNHAADALGPWAAGPMLGAQIYAAKKLGLLDDTEAAGIARKIRSTVAFGLDDEAIGGIASLGGKGDEARQAERRSLKNYEAAHPLQSLAVGVGSSLATLPMAAAAAPARVAQFMKPARTLGGRMLQGTGVGGGLGATYGFGEGEGVQDRLERAGTGLLTGAALGGATVPVAAAVGKVAKVASAPLRAWLQPTKMANEKMLESLQRDGGGGARLQAAGKSSIKQLMNDPDTMVADLGGVNFQGTIKQAARMPNAQREVFKTKLDARQARQVTRFTDRLSKMFGSPEQYEDKIAGLLDRRTREARPMFKAAFAKPAVVSPENKAKMASLLSTPTGKKLMEKAVRFAQDEQQSLQDMSSTRIIHIVKMQADDILNGLKNRREGLGAWDFNRVAKFKRQLLDLVENDTYKAALKQFADTTKIKAAGERGFRHGLKEDAGLIAEAMRKMSPPERQAYRLGLGKYLVTKIRAGNKMHDRVQRDFSDKNFMDKIRLALGGKAWKGNSKNLLPTDYREFQRFLNAKGTQATTRRTVQGGSDTMQNINEAGNLAQEAEAIKSLARGLVDPSEMMGFFGRQYSKLTGLTPGVANAILKRAGQPANKAAYSPSMGPRTQDDIDRALAAYASGKPMAEIKSKYRDIVRALIALEGYSAGQGQQP